jgi:hypothetical protein
MEGDNMRTSEELKAMSQHPAGHAVVTAQHEPVAAQTTESESPAQAHFDALEQLKDAILLHGTASLEAQVCRRRVDRTRLAVLAWKKSEIAA